MSRLQGSAIVQRTYGVATYMMGEWVLDKVEPHVSIRLKKIFPKIPVYSTPPFRFPATPEYCAELEWFMERYPMEMASKDRKFLSKGSKQYSKILYELDAILMPEFKPTTCDTIFIHEDKQPRHYQWQMAEIATQRGVSICGDVMGLGKTVTGIATVVLNVKNGPAAVVVPTHLLAQWRDRIAEFTGLRVHIIKSGSPYNLPEADIYIFKYGLLKGWTDIFALSFFYTVVFDEVQELRTGTISQRGAAAKILCSHAKIRLGLSGTPIYNYAQEIWNIFDILQDGIIGSKMEFEREWCTSIGAGKFKVNDPEALGRYLREQHLLIRRTKKDVGMEIGKVTRIVETVAYNDTQVKSFEHLAKQLAITASTGSFLQRGQASRELDMMARQITGIAKAQSVADLAEMLLESGESVLLSGWHREVYRIWQNRLGHHKPVMYTGSESEKQKEQAKKDFVSGQSRLMIISNRSGAGLDGLQEACSTLIVGELDWSHKVHEQLEKRLDRDGQSNPVMVLYPVSDGGSDPVMMDIIGLKNSQANGVMDPDGEQDMDYGVDESRIKKLVNYYLQK